VNEELTLTGDEIGTLMEALKAWEEKDLAGDMMLDVLDLTLRDKHGEVPADYQRSKDERKVERERAKQQRKEQSVLLQAKLIQMRDRARVDAFADSALRR
jgi:hypothetical protein